MVVDVLRSSRDYSYVLHCVVCLESVTNEEKKGNQHFCTAEKQCAKQTAGVTNPSYLYANSVSESKGNVTASILSATDAL